MRLIDADEFEKQLNRYVEYSDDGEQEINVDAVFITLHEQPTADAVEVVRCKDCADWQTDWIPSCGDNGSHYCATMDGATKPTDYCSYGERRENG